MPSFEFDGLMDLSDFLSVDTEPTECDVVKPDSGEAASNNTLCSVHPNEGTDSSSEQSFLEKYGMLGVSFEELCHRAINAHFNSDDTIAGSEILSAVTIRFIFDVASTENLIEYVKTQFFSLCNDPLSTAAKWIFFEIRTMSLERGQRSHNDQRNLRLMYVVYERLVIAMSPIEVRRMCALHGAEGMDTASDAEKIAFLRQMEIGNRGDFMRFVLILKSPPKTDLDSDVDALIYATRELFTTRATMADLIRDIPRFTGKMWSSFCDDLVYHIGKTLPEAHLREIQYFLLYSA